jgi:hypothetical protein
MRDGRTQNQAGERKRVMSGFDAHKSQLGRLGKYKTGKSCLYVKRLADIDEAILRQLVEASVACMRDRYPTNQRRIARGSRR